MEIKDILAKIAEYDEGEAPDGMNLAEAEIKARAIDDAFEVHLEILNGGIVCKGKTYNDEKNVDFGFVSEMIGKPFKASLDNEKDPKELAKQCAEILKKYIDSAEQEILTLLQENGFTNTKLTIDNDNELV